MRLVRIGMSAIIAVSIFALAGVRLTHSELDNMPGPDPSTIEWVHVVPLPR
jgi:hypothetical protein